VKFEKTLRDRSPHSPDVARPAGLVSWSDAAR
jgi:hypothetical protein